MHISEYKIHYQEEENHVLLLVPCQMSNQLYNRFYSILTERI